MAHAPPALSRGHRAHARADRRRRLLHGPENVSAEEKHAFHPECQYLTPRRERRGRLCLQALCAAHPAHAARPALDAADGFCRGAKKQRRLHPPHGGRQQAPRAPVREAAHQHAAFLWHGHSGAHHAL